MCTSRLAWQHSGASVRGQHTICRGQHTICRGQHTICRVQHTNFRVLQRGRPQQYSEELRMLSYMRWRTLPHLRWKHSSHTRWTHSSPALPLGWNQMVTVVVYLNRTHRLSMPAVHLDGHKRKEVVRQTGQLWCHQAGSCVGETSPMSQTWRYYLRNAGDLQDPGCQIRTSQVLHAAALAVMHAMLLLVCHASNV